MVGPAAKREAVAHLRGVHQMSERRACSLIATIAKMIRYRSRRAPDTELHTVSDLPINGAGSAIAACSSCCETRASRPASTASFELLGRRDWPCANAEVAARR